MYKVIWKDKASKQLAKIDRVMAKKIKDKVKKYLAQDPLNRGEPLSYEYQGLYRYRFSDYRVVYEVKEKELVIFVVKVGHRKEVY
jgi:mRNA interferase RelE/StbE